MSDGTVLVWHAYYVGQSRARLLHSASLFREASDSAFRTLVGRANRYQHWRDMLKLKADGLTTYDMGGWYAGSEDEAKLSINKFKEGFGGETVVEYHCEEAVSLKGKLYKIARRPRHR